MGVYRVLVRELAFLDDRFDVKQDLGVSFLLKFTCTPMLLLAGLPASGDESPDRRVRPVGLRPGDTVMFVAPSGPLEREKMERAQDRLESMGFRVRTPDNLYRQRGYLAGSDTARAAELMAAWTDPEVKAVFPGRGGYGLSRLLDHLDYAKIAANPKILIGFSDITALHLALAAKTDMITFHSPNAMSGLGGPNNLNQFSADSFWRCLLADQNRGPTGFVYKAPKGSSPLAMLRGGVATGRLIGGNLSLIIALMGTPYEIDTEGAVLFMEDVGEAPYRIDRYLSQMRLAGKLNSPAAVLLGQFTKCVADSGESTLTLDEVFDDYFGDAPYPVIKNFPVGHHKWNATLPIGAMAEVDGHRCSVRLLENPVRVDSPAQVQKLPGAEVKSLALGHERIRVVTERFGDDRLLFANLHDNENTSVNAATAVLSPRAVGRLVELQHRAIRNLQFRVAAQQYKCDPNRIFSSVGIRQTLENLSHWDVAAQQVVESFAAKLLQIYSLDTVDILVALHNNTDENYSATQYLKGHELGSEAADVHLEVAHDPDDFFFVTERDLFDALSAKRFNVVLQDNQKVTDDGSLSVYCAEHGVPYINVEAQQGHLKEQKAMIHALLDVLTDMNRLKQASGTRHP